tara:strand:- start:1856 stop:2005 length:150 start_codon:yes stop_codon:yes gene_type:complete
MIFKLSNFNGTAQENSGFDKDHKNIDFYSNYPDDLQLNLGHNEQFSRTL